MASSEVAVETQVSVFACEFVLWIVRVGTVVVALRAYQTVRGRLLTPVAGVKVIVALARLWTVVPLVAVRVAAWLCACRCAATLAVCLNHVHISALIVIVLGCTSSRAMLASCRACCCSADGLSCCGVCRCTPGLEQHIPIVPLKKSENGLMGCGIDLKRSVVCHVLN